MLVIGQDGSSALTSHEAAVDLSNLRACQKAQPLRPYEILFDYDRWSNAAYSAADEIMSRGWQLRHFPRIKLDVPIDWRSSCAANRSWHFHLYCWDALAPILATYDHEVAPEYLDFAVQIALDWARQHQSLDSDAPFAWYDMAIGVRAYRLAYIADAALRDDRYGDDVLRELVQSVLLHASALADDANFAAHSNHGFYFAAGQLALSRRLACLPGMDEQHAQAVDRVERLIRTQFIIEEGMHREHSPDYHRMVHETFDGLLRADLLDDTAWNDRRDQIQDALAWLTLPNGRIAMFGDSSHRSLISDNYEHISADHWRFVASGGQSGRPPADIWRSFPTAGYVVFRDGWPRGSDDFSDWTYLAQICAFHSRVHKHADDLSFVWYDHGQEILVDAGRFGYLDRTDPESELGQQGFYYAHPSRVYVESTRAHNTVEIDHRSYQRRGIKPYGSALRDSGERGGVYFSVASVRHFKTIRHRRTLLLRPREWLLVVDWLHDNAEDPHRFSQRFHFAPELDAVRLEGADRIVLSGDAPPLHVVSLLESERLPLVKGQKEPELLGWISPVDGKLEPCWTGGQVIDGREHHAFASLLHFGGQAPEPGKSAINYTGRRGSFRWRDDRGDNTVVVELTEDERVSLLDYRLGVQQA